MSHHLTTMFRRDAIRWLVIVIVAAGVAFAVSSLRARDDNAADRIPDAVPVVLEDRATVSLQDATIQPVLSGDGRVVPGEQDETWVIEAAIEPADLAYRLMEEPVGVKARILGGPAGFNCPWLGLGVGADGNVTMRCQIPDDIPVVEGLHATMVLQMEDAKEVPALPIAAVIGNATQGQVVIVNDDGSTEARDVELGIADTFNIEIVSGLSPEEKVLAAPIQRDFNDASS